ncbi:hypothetical protein [Bufonid herpesvirus 1]|uniref:hypothetical protein n=1 Tax=Bufonid herpesvirus 1 TaxID=2282206 RepID=UPI000EB6C9D2|nr:hypothetical protein [Bufonid herpesvirus 1]AXF48635.1 hypothetical protein [Bufonid herpesvirus 1]
MGDFTKLYNLMFQQPFEPDFLMGELTAFFKAFIFALCNTQRTGMTSVIDLVGVKVAIADLKHEAQAGSVTKRTHTKPKVLPTVLNLTLQTTEDTNLIVDNIQDLTVVALLELCLAMCSKSDKAACFIGILINALKNPRKTVYNSLPYSHKASVRPYFENFCLEKNILFPQSNLDSNSDMLNGVLALYLESQSKKCLYSAHPCKQAYT